MESIKEIQEHLKNTPVEELVTVIEEYKSDERAGVVKLVKTYENRYSKLLLEKERIWKMGEFERKYSDRYKYIGGIDEVGRGPLAGPVVTCCVILPKDCSILYVNDSKQVSAQRREELYDIIMEQAICVGIGIESPATIDDINILQATYKAMRQSIDKMQIKPEILLNDAVRIPEVTIPQVPIIHGDATSITIAAASIIAKVTRDRMMVEYDKIFPGYDFAGNKGYGSQKHIEALKTIGPCAIHRASFIKNFV